MCHLGKKVKTGTPRNGLENYHPTLGRGQQALYSVSNHDSKL